MAFRSAVSQSDMSVVGSSSTVEDCRPRTIESRPERLTQTPVAEAVRLTPGRAFSLPLAFILGLTAFGFLDSVRQNPTLLRSVLGAGLALFVWNAVLCALALRQGRTLTLEIVLRKQHYVQACAQGSVLLYWGWYWRQTYDAAPLIVAQIVLAYAFDMLLTWSRRDTYALGFAPFPVIFSINLFLWFKSDWFYFQFLMVALGFAAKELIRWDKEGRSAHIFNPSSFPLALFSLGLILTGMSDVTWGKEIAVTQFYPPHMYVMLFLIALPGQFLFGVTSMTMAAVVTTYLFGLAYLAITGTYFFYDSYVPIAVFLGMHLLFTDPATSPRTELGRIMFGALYGLSTVFLYGLLGTLGMPTFYDKLLQVPILNLSIKLIDRTARSNVLRRFDPATLGQSLAPRQRHLAYISIWGIVFVSMTAARGVGDRHAGQWLPFWQQACGEQRPRACRYLFQTEVRFCDAGSGWACNELAILGAQSTFDPAGAAASLERGCDLGFLIACANAERVAGAGMLQRAPPALDDYPIVLRGTKGPIADRTPSGLYARACSQGWPDACAQR
jgi:Na+-translocating ferredoxin:NAD+ oxidoreductase RnfD subunit